jgi:hypothetical protein
MSSSISSTLSAGAQLLSGYSNLLPGPPETDLSGSSADAGVQRARGIQPAQGDQFASGSSNSADGDTVELSAEALQMLGQMGEGGHSYETSAHSTHPYSIAAAYQSIDVLG